MAGALLVILIAWLAVSAGWLWLCAGIYKTGARRIVGAIALQLSLVTLSFGFLTGAGFWAFVIALVPPVMIFSLWEIAKFHAFLSLFLAPTAAVSVFALAVCLAVPRLRIWSVGATLIAFLVAGVIFGERASQRAMSSAAEAAGIRDFKRHTLIWSLANAPRKFQGDIHAEAKLGGRWLGWSYRELGWYEIPSDVWGNVDAKVSNSSE